MKRISRLWLVLVALAMSWLPTGSAEARGPYDEGSVIFGGEYTLHSGETLNGDLVIFGGVVTIEEAAIVRGSLIVFGGFFTLDGAVTGDVILFGGEGRLGEKAVVEGDLVTIGGQIRQAEGARVEGDVLQEAAIRISIPQILKQVWTSDARSLIISEPLEMAFGVLIRALLLGLLALVLALFLQPQMEQVAQVTIQQPLIAGGAGLLVVIAAPILAVLMIVTLLLIPLVPLVALVIVIGWLFGLTALGSEVGSRLSCALRRSWSPPWTAGLGTLVLVLVTDGLGQIPCVGWMVPFLVGVIGLGGVTLSLLERRQRPGASKPAEVQEEPPPPPS